MSPSDPFPVHTATRLPPSSSRSPSSAAQAVQDPEQGRKWQGGAPTPAASLAVLTFTFKMRDRFPP